LKLSDLVEAFFSVGHAHVDVQVLDVEGGVGVTEHLLVGLDDLLDVVVDEVVERVYVLLHQAFRLQESRYQLPFFLQKWKM